MAKPRKILVYTVLLVPLAVLLLVPTLLEYAARTGLTRLRSSGLSISADNVRGFFPGIAADSVSVNVPIATGRRFPAAIPLLVPLENVRSSLKASLSRSLIPPIETTARLWNGDIKIVAYSTTAQTTLNGYINNLDLSTPPLFRSFGLLRGILNASLSNIKASPALPSSGDVTLDLSDISLSTSTFIPPILGLQLLEIYELKTSGSFEEHRVINISSLSARSNLLSISGKGRARVNSSLQIDEFAGKFLITMDGSDSDKIRGWLPLVTNGRVSADRNSFACTLRPTSCRDKDPGLQITPSRCIKYSCR